MVKQQRNHRDHTIKIDNFTWALIGLFDTMTGGALIEEIDILTPESSLLFDRQVCCYEVKGKRDGKSFSMKSMLFEDEVK